VRPQQVGFGVKRNHVFDVSAQTCKEYIMQIPLNGEMVGQV
jgi:hypothetical protein